MSPHRSSGSADFVQVKVIVVGTPIWAFVGETSTGFAGGLLTVPFVVIDVPPVPFTLTVTVGKPVLGISKVSLAAALAVGAKRTVSVQVAADASVLPEQVSFKMLKGVASGSALAIWPMTKSAEPLLVAVIVASAEPPTRTPPNGTCWSVAGGIESVTVMRGTSSAVPLRATRRGGAAIPATHVPGILTFTVLMATSGAAASCFGAKATVTVQVLGGAPTSAAGRVPSNRCRQLW